MRSLRNGSDAKPQPTHRRRLGRAHVSLTVLAAVALVATSCGRTTIRTTASDPTAVDISQLWQEPTDLRTRDLFAGPVDGAPVPLPDEQLLDHAATVHAGLGALHRLLQDPVRSTIRLVLQPERLVVAESLRMATHLSLFGYAVDAVVVNRLLPDAVADPYLARWKDRQAEHLRSQLAGALHKLARHHAAQLRVAGEPPDQQGESDGADAVAEPQAVVINAGVANAATGEQGIADARHTAAEVASALDIEPEETVVLGFSQGGVVSLDVTLNEGVASRAGCLSGYLSVPEAPAAPRAPLRVFVAHGTQDGLIAVQVARKTKRFLEEMKVPVAYHEYAMGHEILPEEVVALRSWLSS